MSSKPIRVGVIGLASSWRGWGANAHLPYLAVSSQYEITAICNSSITSARQSAIFYCLDMSVIRFYDDPVSLAIDSNVDLVVCCVNAAKHYELIRPALEAGKDVFCEWPLGSHLREMIELTEIAEANGSRTMIGLQSRMNPAIAKIKEFTGEKKHLGKILSSQMFARSPSIGSTVPFTFECFLDIRSGGSLFTINSIHLLETTITALEGDIETSSTLLSIQSPLVEVYVRRPGKNSRIVRTSTPDHILIHGTLSNGVLFSLDLRSGHPFKGEDPFQWNIICERGQIKVQSSDEAFWKSTENIMKIHFQEPDSVEEVRLKLDDDSVAAKLDHPADSVGYLYDAFAKGQKGKYLDFRESLKWADFISNAYAANDMEVESFYPSSFPEHDSAFTQRGIQNRRAF